MGEPPLFAGSIDYLFSSSSAMSLFWKSLLFSALLLLSVPNTFADGVEVETTKDENPVRNTTSGPVMGEVRINKYGTLEPYYAFHAIPYGMPPINSERFQPPQPPKPWTEVYDASDSEEYRCCYQYDDGTPYKMSEDCLLLSVYSPVESSKTEESLPVVVWIHGGSLVSGCGMYPMYGPD